LQWSKPTLLEHRAIPGPASLRAPQSAADFTAVDQL
jgi:hypothetical protein